MKAIIGRSLFVGLLWIYSIFYYIECIHFEDATEKMTVVTIFWVFTLFVILELIVLLKSFLASSEKRPVFSKKVIFAFLTDYRFHLIITIVLYLFLMPYLGFYLSSFFAFCAFSYILGTRSILKMVVPGLIVLIFIYVTFTMLLNIILPQGMIF